MRLDHAAAAILIAGLLWAQRFPAVNNHVPELRVVEVLQSGNNLKVTLQNISSRTIRGLSAELGKRKTNQDWSNLTGGGLLPNGTASLTISMAGLPVGGTRHHPEPPPPLELLSAVYADSATPATPKPEPNKPAAAAGPARLAPPPVQQPQPAPLPPSSATGDSARPVSAPAPAPVRKVEPNTPPVAADPKTPSPKSTPEAKPAASIPPAPPQQQQRQPAPPATEISTAAPPRTLQTRPAPTPKVEPPPAKSEPPPATPAPPAAPPRVASGQPGTREQGIADELTRLVALVERFEPELASAFPRQGLHKMVAAVVAEQNAIAPQPAVTPFDQGQRNTLQSFVFGLQTIEGRRELDDDALREQVQRFLKNRRQALAKP